ncbi:MULTISPECIES: MFS transporter [Chryseobacterium]|jgi:fucose permease|uniref:Fucose permease n=1 Tax=Chryseobacterium geocarposphaerae TaxID=1416776 RepID=A0ABU1LI73_9FLAO|nr:MULTISPECIES: MFS transporter [Chryseobacterium]ALR31569.1 MFS transporter [Chryseobacterium sp. IHB B 17019]MDR6406431.1 fucose permease [Chryseobacterium geocarposphaerae]MDR6699867.1 fucose permease [Chryseobacterium ginsenosidimutans]
MDSNQQTKWSQFLSLIVVFFFWGFVAASNDILIPVFKKWFVLSQVQSQLVAWAFYVAYFVGSVIFFIISLKSDILQKFGYKKTLAVGLGLSAFGAFLFVPAASAASFWFFLSALFIVGLGFSVQQIVANPLAIKMGSPRTGAHRLTLAGGINSLGTTIGPILVGIALFGMGDKNESKAPDPNLSKIEIVKNEFTAHKEELSKNIIALKKDTQDDPVKVQEVVSTIEKNIADLDTQVAQIDQNPANAEAQIDAYATKLGEIKQRSSNINYPIEFVKDNLKMVKVPFIVLGIAFILVAIFMLFSKIEDPAKEEEAELEQGTPKFSIFSYPQLYLGMLAIFLYVGVEVSIISNLPALLHTKEFGGVLEHNIAPFVSLYWGSLMIGRWNGSINVFNISKASNLILKFVVPFIAFGIIIVANELSGKDVSSFYIYALWIIAFIIMSFIGGKNAGKTLMIFGIAGVVMMLLGLVYPDKEIAKYFFISGGLFCSIMWPSIFDLAIAGLGKNTGKASSFLVMMILGGGIIPLIQGWLCDFDKTSPEGIMGITWTHFSYIIPIICFIYLAFYGFIAPAILKKQGVEVEESKGGGH